jgi:hypothetical protein
MALTDKTRKILWARSGNLCAICHQKLVVDETQLDAESVVGEECHICAQSPGGPRFNPLFSADRINALENLILLCSNDHKKIDDQHQAHPAEWLRAKKAAHEKWVEDKLTESAELRPMRIVRTKANVPQKMDRITSGKMLLNIASQCHSGNSDYDENLDDAEAELVAGFLQDVIDYAEIARDTDMAEHVKIARSLNERLKELEESGFYLFAAVEDARVEGGTHGPIPWKIFHQMLTRATNPNIRWTESSGGRSHSSK